MISPGELASLGAPELWALHEQVIRDSSNTPTRTSRKIGQYASLLDVKLELANRMLRNCTLCARRCGVDRLQGEFGACKLGEKAYVAEHFVHIGEEPMINPSLVLNLHGCALRCRFCQQHELIESEVFGGTLLDERLWDQLNTTGARSISFVGGNPDESLPAILRMLHNVPDTWKLPIVWNNHAYSTIEVLKLLHGVVDAYVPDLKYMNDRCGERLSGIANYPETAMAAVLAMVEQSVPVIVRILVLPGHTDCCHLPCLDYLATLPQENLFISIRSQYSPDWKITNRDGALARRPTREEGMALVDRGHQLGLKLVD